MKTIDALNRENKRLTERVSVLEDLDTTRRHLIGELLRTIKPVLDDYETHEGLMEGVWQHIPGYTPPSLAVAARDAIFNAEGAD